MLGQVRRDTKELFNFIVVRFTTEVTSLPYLSVSPNGEPYAPDRGDKVT